MSVLAQLKDYLDQNQIKYTVITHSQAFTAQELAQMIHVPGRELAKTVMIRVDGNAALAVLPATQQINFANLKRALGANIVELLTEAEFENYFPACELGSMPPFGNLFNLTVFVSRSLRDDEEIVFNAGSLTDAIRMTYTDFERLVQPIVCEFSEMPGKAKSAS